MAIDAPNGLCARDALGAQVRHGLSFGWDLQQVVRFANPASAIVTGWLRFSGAMPTEAEVNELLANGRGGTRA